MNRKENHRRTQYQFGAAVSVCCLSKFNQGIFFEALRQKRSRETLHTRRRRLRLIQFWGVLVALAQISKFACDKGERRARDYKNTLQ
jgi:hypothetical protein